MYDSVRIKNFKSIEDAKIDLRKLNVLIGPNGSGKSNLLEAFLLAMNVTRSSMFSINVYPFSQWWGYKNLVYLHEETRNVEFETNGEIDGRKFSYSFMISGAGERLKIFYEKMSTPEITIERKGTDLIIDGQVFEKSIALEQSILTKLFIPFTLPFQSQVTTLFFENLKNEQQQYEKSADLQFLPSLLSKIFTDIIYLNVIPQRVVAPVPLNLPKSIGPDGFGTIRFLFDWQVEGRMPKIIKDFLEENNLELRFEISEDVFLRMSIIENGVPLPPPSIPSGYAKMLAILTAVALKPSLILIDEIENSLHLKFIEELLDVLEYSESKVIIATHSPLVVDLVDPEDLIQVEKIGMTSKFERIPDPEKLKKKLLEKGLTLSESWLYGNFFKETR